MAQWKKSGAEDGRNTILLIGVLLVLIVLVGGGLLYIITQKGGKVEPPPVQNETPKPPQNLSNLTNLTNVTPQCDDSCLLSRAVSAGNVSGCGQLSTDQSRQDCYGQLSGLYLDACKLVQNESKLESCITAFAVSGKNISLCDLLADKTDCRKAVDACADAAEAALCRALQANDPAKCGSNQTCLLDYASEKNEDSACSLIQNTVVSAECRSLALASDRCSALPADSEQDYCYELWALNSDNFLICTQISDDTTYALDCYSTFAARLGNYSICDGDGFDLNNRWACYTNYSLLSGDKTGCERIHYLASTNKFKCSFEFAKKFGDPSACELLNDTGSRSTCYEGSIIYSNQNLDWNNCDGVLSFVWRNKCYAEAAKLYHDASICDYITEDFARTSCRESFTQNQTG